jgi:hypothetical protein
MDHSTKKLQKSSTSNVNFLWNDDYIYIMDNHLLAAWCWSQKLNEGQKYSIIHIDAHHDLGRIGGKNGKEFSPFQKLSLEEYMRLTAEITSYSIQKAVQYDNYFTLFLDQYSEFIEKIYTSTYQEFNADIKFTIEPNIESSYLIYFLKNNLRDAKNWIINIDIDYFYCQYIDDNDRFYNIRLYSKRFIQELVDTLLSYKNRIYSLTIALSPECCGGWDNAINICNFIVDRMKIDFSLPPQSYESK